MTNKMVDKSELLSQLEGDEQLLRELIDTFFAESGSLLQHVLDAVSSRDAVALNHAAHKLKGTVSIFGCQPASAAAAVLETMGRNGDLTRAEDAGAQLKQQMEALEAALRQLREEYVQSSDRG